MKCKIFADQPLHAEPKHILHTLFCFIGNENHTQVLDQENDEQQNISVSEMPYISSQETQMLETATNETSETDKNYNIDTPLKRRQYKKLRLSEMEKKEHHLASEQKRREKYRLAIDRLDLMLPSIGQPDKSQCQLIWRGRDTLLEYIYVVKAVHFICPSIKRSKNNFIVRGLIF